MPQCFIFITKHRAQCCHVSWFLLWNWNLILKLYIFLFEYLFYFYLLPMQIKISFIFLWNFGIYSMQRKTDTWHFRIFFYKIYTNNSKSVDLSCLCRTLGVFSHLRPYLSFFDKRVSDNEDVAWYRREKVVFFISTLFEFLFLITFDKIRYYWDKIIKYVKNKF